MATKDRLGLAQPGKIATVLAMLAYCLFALPAQADRRVALVIGNRAYKELPALANPVRDAAAVSRQLRDHGFEVLERSNLNRSQFLDALDELRNRSAGAELALVFYAGHGGSVGERDVLAPVDMRYSCDERSFERILPIEQVFEAIGSARNKIVILDACRNQTNPKCPTRGVGAISSFRGLSRIDSSGLLIASSTSPGELADDGIAGSHSPFAAALLGYFEKQPRLRLFDTLARVSADVVSATQGRQTPEIKLRGAGPEVCLAKDGCEGQASAPAQPIPVAPAVAPPPRPTSKPRPVHPPVQRPQQPAQRQPPPQVAKPADGLTNAERRYLEGCYNGTIPGGTSFNTRPDFRCRTLERKAAAAKRR